MKYVARARNIPIIKCRGCRSTVGRILIDITIDTIFIRFWGKLFQHTSNGIKIQSVYKQRHNKKGQGKNQKNTVVGL